jgi:plastocyanin
MLENSGSARLLVASFFALTMAACGGGDGGSEGAAPAAGGEGAAAAAPVEVANPATLKGVISFEGAVPANEAIDMSEEPVCAAKHSDAQQKETVVANDGKLKNVFIYVKEGLTGTYPAKTERVEIDQDGCIYEPHVVGVQVGQPIVFHNKDAVLHNIKATPTANRPFNISQPTEGLESERTFSAAEVMVPVECNVHGWMQAYVGVVNSPYFAVSGDDGSFEIGNLPPGTYTIEMWHEKYGTQTQQVTLGADETKDITASYSAGMAANAVVPLGRPIDPHGTHVALAHPGH